MQAEDIVYNPGTVDCGRSAPSSQCPTLNNLRLVLTIDRPISITPILATIMKKQIVRTFLYPPVAHPDYTCSCSKISSLFALLAPPPLHLFTFFTYLLRTLHTTIRLVRWSDG